MSERLPVQLAVAFGATTGLYAASLAVVTGLQAEHDQAIAASRSTIASDVGLLSDANDLLAAELDRAVAAYDAAASAYAISSEALVGHEERLSTLGSEVSKVTGAAAALPKGVPLARVSRAAGRSAPTAHATTGAS